MNLIITFIALLIFRISVCIAASIYTYGNWNILSSSGLTPTRMYHSAVYSASTSLIYVIGGGDTNNDYSDVWTYNVNTLIWSSVTTNGGSFTTREGFSAVLDTTSQIIYVFGGFLGTGNVANDLWSFATSTGKNISFEESLITFHSVSYVISHLVASICVRIHPDCS